MELIDRLRQHCQARWGRPPALVACAPGRVNLIGEHIDYNAGFVLPAAIDRATWVAVVPDEAPTLTLEALDLGEAAVLSLDGLDDKPAQTWARYPGGVAWALRDAGLEVRGMKAVYASTVPRAAGLSSSASVEMAFAMAFQQLGGWSRSPMELALLCQRAENKYVGVNCGIMDQFASACGQAGQALLLDCRSLTWEAVSVPAGTAIVIANTCVRRELGSSAYNERRAQCEEAVRLLAARLPGIRALRDVAVADFERHLGLLPAKVAQRARHVVVECERTPAGAALLRKGDAAGFGRLMNECHASLRDLYEVSCPELDVMVAAAQRLPGCYGARLTGAGFGGCTVNLVEAGATAAFSEALGAAYTAATGLQGEIYVCQASAGARVV
ncbi:MAG: galactokinase [Candidatus Latescibacteria bacterium]|nr:galactokinase [Candidatus Latescibacterota bacterium]